MNNIFYESDDLIIRPYKTGDEASLAFFSNNRQIAQKLGNWFPSPFTYDDACVWVAQHSVSLLNFPIIYYGDVIGNIGIRNIDGSKADLIIWISPEFTDIDISSRACQWMKKYAFEQLGINVVF